MQNKSELVKCLLQENERDIYKTEHLVLEKVLQIIVNGQVFSMTMQTPGDERYLVRGLLHAEGFNDSEFLSYSQIEDDNSTTVSVTVACKKTIDGNRRIGSTSSCGLCGKKSVGDLFTSIQYVEREQTICAKDISRNYATIFKLQELFCHTGGCHAASALNVSGEALCVFEDIGRHNAVDKVIGYLLEHNQLNEAVVLTVSGRVSFEIVQKCSRAKIPVLTAISAPSSLAVKMAEHANITLAAFCREQRATFYSGFNRVLLETPIGE
jgi:FdhD protein